jgi:hypothetical protein
MSCNSGNASNASESKPKLCQCHFTALAHRRHPQVRRPGPPREQHCQRFLHRVRADEAGPVEAVEGNRNIHEQIGIVDIENRQNRKQHWFGAQIDQRFGEVRRLPGGAGNDDMQALERMGGRHRHQPSDARMSSAP